MTGDQEQGGGAEHFHPGHLPVRSVPGDQLGEHVVAGRPAAFVDEPGQVHPQFGAGLLGEAAPLAGVLAGVRVEAGGDDVGPGVEAGLVLARNAQQPADHGDGEGVREVVDDVDLPPVPETVDEVGDDAGQFAAHVVDAPGRFRRPERAHRHTAQPVVLGRVQPQEGGWQGRGLLLLEQGARGTGERLRASELIRGSCSRLLISQYVLTTNSSSPSWRTGFLRSSVYSGYGSARLA